MTNSAPPADAGMVDVLTENAWTLTDVEIEFARAYLAEGPLPPDFLARSLDPARITERERVKALRLSQDWAGLGRYRDANANAAGQTVDVVFMGDSITEMWRIAEPSRFALPRANRGISGQTSPQMLLRFMPDVIALKPKAVHLMCGVNDIAGNTGASTPGDYHNNMLAMLDLARANGIRVILASLTPVTGFMWAPHLPSPRPRVASLNAWLRKLADERGFVFADYHAALATDDGALQPELTRDGVHPTSKGYDVMAPACDRAIAEVLSGV